jgi:hypothetical protein
VSLADECDRERGTTEVNFKGEVKDPRSNGGDEGENMIESPLLSNCQILERFPECDDGSAKTYRTEFLFIGLGAEGR